MIMYESEFATVEYNEICLPQMDHLVVTLNSHISAARKAQIPENPLKGGWKKEVEQKGYPGLYLIEKENFWFNLPDMDNFLEVATSFRRKFKTCTIVGASLGAHAAIRLSKKLDATVVVAVSPQFCINPRVVGHFETRWSADTQKIPFFEPTMTPETVSGDIYIISDNEHELDAKHVDMITKAIDVKRVVDLPYSGHSSARALADLNLIKAILNIKKHNAAVFIDHIENTYNSKWNTSPTALKIRSEFMPPRERLEFLSNMKNVIGLPSHKNDLESFIKETREQIDRSY